MSIWLDQALHPNLPHYTIGAALEVSGRLDPALLRLAIMQVAQSHDALRMVLAIDSGHVPKQRLLRDIDPPFQVVDFSAHVDAEQRALGYVDGVSRRQIPLGPGLLWECELVVVSDQRCWLLCRAHHLTADGVAIELLTRDIERAYQALSLDPAADVRISNPSYFEFIDDEHAYFGSTRYQRDREYWLLRHQQLPEPLVVRQPGVIGPTPRSGVAYLLLDRHRVQMLEALAAEHGSSLAHLLLSVVTVYFTRTADVDDVVIGYAAHNRSNARQRRTFGMFATVLPLRLTAKRNAPVSDLLAVIAGEIRRAYRHQRFPLTELNRHLQPVIHGRAQIFDVTFSYQAFGGAYKFGDSVAHVRATDHGHEQVPLAIAVRDYDTNAALELAFHYNLGNWQAEQIDALVARLDYLLTTLIDSPDLLVGQLPLLTPNELQIISDSLAVESLPQLPVLPSLVHQSFEHQVVRNPLALAVIGEGVAQTYGALNARANQIAHRLIALGVKPDERVGLFVRRSPEMLAGLLGILKSGAAYLPMDLDYPAERLAYMMCDATPVAVVAEHAVLARMPVMDASVPVLLLDTDEDLAIAPSSNPVAAELKLLPRHLSYVIYTSGSTGQAKGVLVEHRQVVQQMATHIDYCGLSSSDRMLQFASIGFDSAVVEIFPALAVGATLVLRPAGMSLPDAGFLDYLDRFLVTVTDLPTAFWAQWTQRIAAGESRTGIAQRLMVVGGEKVETQCLHAWLKTPAVAQCRWINSYGPTEATVYSTAISFAPNDTFEQAEVPIGRPTGASRIYLLDKSGELLPPGATGEICIGGPGVARGYLNRPELTAERFISDRFSACPEARLYRTGDLGRWRDDGMLEFLGRNDCQVKLRGFRIELGEIEAQLVTHADLVGAVVLLREDVAIEPRLVAYVVPVTGSSPSARMLYEHLAQTLPEYMRPSAYVCLDALPVTVNGKIDRLALPRPDQRALVSRDYAPPETALEQLLAQVWQELLGIDRVGRDDNFFELGGHSLLVIALVERLRQAGVRAEVGALFGAPSLSALAGQLALETAPFAAQSAGLAPPNRIPSECSKITPDMLSMLTLSPAEIDTLVAAVPGGAGNVQDVYPLAPLQEGMLFHHLLEGQGDAYLMHTLLAFDDLGRLNQFLQALQQVIDRHDVLRTAVHWQALSAPVQLVQRQAPLPVQILHFDGDVLAQLTAATNPSKQRLDLRQAPLMAAHVAADPAHERWLLALLDHHLVCDHITLELIIEEVGLILQGRPEQLLPPLPYRNFVAHTLMAPQSEHEKYFRAELGDISESTAPFGVMEVHAASDQVQEVQQLLPDALSGSLRAKARELSMTPSVVFHLAWAMVIGRCSGRDQVVFGTVLAGRLQGSAGADRAMGLFLNTLPLRIPLLDGCVNDALRDTQRRLSELLAHEQVPLALAQRCSGIQSPLPLFTSMLNYRHTSISPVENKNGALVGGWGGVSLLSVEERTNYPLSTSVDDLGENFLVTVQCAPAINPRRIADYLLQAISSILTANPDDSLRDLEVISPRERAELVAASPVDSIGKGDLLFAHREFERHAAEQPCSTALACGGQTISYSELNRRANRLALQLREFSICPDDRIALYLPRGADWIVAILAVWKAGAAYVPLDPAYPTERLSFMLADCAAKILVTTVRNSSECQQRFGSQSSLVILVTDRDTAGAGSGELDDDNLDCSSLRPEHLAYVIYTSGSTGQPKGVMVTHRGLLPLYKEQAAVFGIGPGDSILQFASPSFDASVFEIIMALCSGARLHLASTDELTPGPPLLELLSSGMITNTLLPASALVAMGSEAAIKLAQHGLTVVAGGDVLPSGLARHWAKYVRLFNAYGPTEATVCATVHRCGHDIENRVPIGRPLAHAVIRVLDAHGRLVPHGVAGEICIGGIGVARGYLHQPDLTAERFVTDGYGVDPSARLYRTGDLGRWREDGELEFLGRNDFQIKLRGYRIELGEIEAQLVNHTEVVDAAVLLREDGLGELRLVAYIVPAGDVSPSAHELREHLAQKLPEHMLPSAYVSLVALPVTPNGKLDRDALPQPNQSALLSRNYVEPVGQVEFDLAALWQVLLGVARIGRHDNFAELGGHSLLTMQLAARINEKFALDLPLRSLMDRPVFADQATLIVDAQLELYVNDDLAVLTDELDSLSEEELRAILMEEATGE